MLFQRDAGWTRDISAAKLELQKKWGLLRDELHDLQITVPTESLGLVMFGREVIKKTKLLVEGVEVLKKTVSDEKAA